MLVRLKKRTGRAKKRREMEAGIDCERKKKRKYKKECKKRTVVALANELLKRKLPFELIMTKFKMDQKKNINLCSFDICSGKLHTQSEQASKYNFRVFFIKNVQISGSVKI